MTKVTRYEIREWVGNSYSVALGRRLRTRQQASRIVKFLKAQKRSAFASPIKINAA